MLNGTLTHRDLRELGDRSGDDQRQTFWIHGYAPGEVDHHKGSFTVDRQFAEELIESHETLAEHGYYPPLLKAHEGDVDEDEVEDTPKDPRRLDSDEDDLEEGFRFGRVVDVKSTHREEADEIDAIDAEGIWYEIEPSKTAAEHYDNGEIAGFSPSFYEPGWKPADLDIDPLPRMTRHVAFAARPKQKGLQNRNPHYAQDVSEGPEIVSVPMSETPASNDQQSIEQEVHELKQLVRDLEERMPVDLQEDTVQVETDALQDALDEKVEGSEMSEAELREEMASEAGISTSALSDIITGDIAEEVPAERVEEIASVLDVSQDSLIEERNESTDSSEESDMSEENSADDERAEQLEQRVRELEEKLGEVKTQRDREKFGRRLDRFNVEDEEVRQQLWELNQNGEAIELAEKLNEHGSDVSNAPPSRSFGETGKQGSAPTSKSMAEKYEQARQDLADEGIQPGTDRYFKEMQERGIDFDKLDEDTNT